MMHRQRDLVAVETVAGVNHHTGRNVDELTLQSNNAHTRCGIQDDAKHEARHMLR